MPLSPCLSRRLIAAAGALALGVFSVWPTAGGAAEDYSAAERALFMTNHVAGIKPPASLKYRYARSGTMGEAFTDEVVVKLKPTAAGGCCDASADFLSGARKLDLPEVEAAESNPAILYFLERDIREMEKLTTGKSNYFRKRIRMAVYQDARVAESTLQYRGKPVPVQMITIRPYVDDPLRARFEKYANKTYVFALSRAVPGGLYGIRSRIDGPTAADAPVAVEELLADGASALPASP